MDAQLPPLCCLCLIFFPSLFTNCERTSKAYFTQTFVQAKHPLKHCAVLVCIFLCLLTSCACSFCFQIFIDSFVTWPHWVLLLSFTMCLLTLLLYAISFFKNSYPNLSLSPILSPVVGSLLTKLSLLQFP